MEGLSWSIERMQRFDFAALVVGFAAAFVAGLVLAPPDTLRKVAGGALACAVVMRLVGALPSELAAAGTDFSRSSYGGRAIGPRAVSTGRWVVLVAASVALGVAAMRLVS